VDLHIHLATSSSRTPPVVNGFVSMVARTIITSGVLYLVAVFAAFLLAIFAVFYFTAHSPPFLLIFYIIFFILFIKKFFRRRGCGQCG